ncbi:MAG: MT-A70 family methyltransferase [Oscillospiraceae bacterium]|nr:MT-A70 family methyltransferase [Oscillospiraceae bacterium]
MVIENLGEYVREYSKTKDKPYGIIYSDPPWQQTKGGLRKARPNQGKQFDYPTMTLDDIKNTHKMCSNIAAEQHNFFVWTIDKYLFSTEEMMKELGYELHARFIWDKENGIAPAFTVRFSHEYLLWFYRKGRMLKPIKEMRGVYTTVIREPSTIHSRKPQAAYEMIEHMFPHCNKLELFARNTRDGWDCWGNEVG